MTKDGKTAFFCNTCKQTHDRSIVIDPAIKWWLGEDGEYWHESAAIFIRNREGKFLMFDRAAFPFGFTVPAGHVDADEDPSATAKRELEEEVGLTGVELKEVVVEDLDIDHCRRGSDIHRWRVFLGVVDETPEVAVNEEGSKPVWIDLQEALKGELTPAVRYVITKHSDTLMA